MQAKGTSPGELKKIMQDRFKAGYYKPPERSRYLIHAVSCAENVSYDPEKTDKVITLNYPHVMHYAPDISNDDIGGAKLGASNVSLFVILPGHHGQVVQPVGVTERAAITKQYEEMLAKLCKIKDLWCLPKEKGQ